MHPLPLTGTETLGAHSRSDCCEDASPTPHGDGNTDDPKNPGQKIDASPTPHGDGNLVLVAKVDGDEKMHPLPLTGTETTFVHTLRIIQQRMHPLPLTGTETVKGVDYFTAAEMHPLPLTGTETRTQSGHLTAKLEMHPLPLTGTETDISHKIIIFQIDASPTPHGDGNGSALPDTVISPMHPLPLSGTAKRISRPLVWEILLYTFD